MQNNKNLSFYMTFLSTLKNYLSISNASLDDIMLNFDLPTQVMQKIQGASLCNFQLNRMCNILGYVLSPLSTSTSKSECYDPLHLISELSKTFSRTVSGYISVNSTCYTKVPLPFPVTVNKAKFELVFLNLLYCSIRCADKLPIRKANLTFYVTENKKSIIFHLRDNGEHIDPKIIQAIFSQKPIRLDYENITESIIALSLEAAVKAAKELDGELLYKELKGGNRFDVSLPKNANIPARVMKSLSIYTPTYPYYDEIFADILLEVNMSESKGETQQ